MGPVRSQDENCPHYPECCDAQAASAPGQKQSPTFANATAELASTPDAKAHNRYAAD